MAVRIKDLTQVFTLDSTTKLIISDTRSSQEEEYKINVFDLLSRNPFKDTSETIVQPWTFKFDEGSLFIQATSQDVFLGIKNVAGNLVGKLGRIGLSDHITLFSEDDTKQIHLGSLAGGDVLKRYGPSGTLYKIWDAGNSNTSSVNWTTNSLTAYGTIDLRVNNQFLVGRDTTAAIKTLIGVNSSNVIKVGDSSVDVDIIGSTVTFNGSPLDFVAPSRTIDTTSPLQGGGDLSADRTLSILDSSTTQKGVVELATTAEAEAGTDTIRATTPAGVKSAIIANNPTTTGTTGTTTLPGGLIMKWGVAGDTTNVSVVFDTAFPTGVVHISTTNIGSSTSNTDYDNYVYDVTTAGFSVRNSRGGSDRTGIYWIAIGY